VAQSRWAIRSVARARSWLRAFCGSWNDATGDMEWWRCVSAVVWAPQEFWNDLI